jgi:hypothetical protein
VFTLACGGASNSIVVTTNGAPLPGEFLVRPTVGEELSTLFAFSAVQLTDEQLPLSYQFGYASAESLSNLVIVSLSEKAYASSVLPAGPALQGYNLSCLLSVVDVLGASSSETVAVTVRQLSDASQQLQELVQGTAITIDDTKRVISIASTVLNRADCSVAPDCTALHRQPCSKTSGVCGACTPGYVGDAGDSNQACVPVSILTYSNISQACVSHADCHYGQRCDSAERVCAFPAKSCLHGCSGHGTCVALEVATGKPTTTTCRLEDTTCEASCSCVKPYTGRGCELEIDTLRSNRATRSILIQSLQNLTLTEDVNVQSVSDWSANLYSLVLNPFELSASDVQRVVDIANSTLKSALALGVTDTYPMLGILQATDAAASMQRQNYNPNDYWDLTAESALFYRNNTAEGVITVVTAFADLISASQVAGEVATTYLYDTFRVSAQVQAVVDGNLNMSLVLPRTDGERAVGAAASTASILLDPQAALATFATKVVAVQPQAYTTDTTNYLSSPFYLQLTSTEGLSTDSVVTRVEFAFQHNEALPQLAHPKATNFTSTCRGDARDEDGYSYTCPGSGVVLHNNCSRGAGTYTQFCPAMVPGCGRLGLESAEISILSSCTVTSFNETHTICSCPVNATNASVRRRLTTSRRLVATTETQVLDETGVSNMLATSTYIGLEFADTFNAASKFNSPDSVMIVIYMFSTLWGAGILLLSVCLTRSYVSKQEKVKQIGNKVAAAAEQLKDGIIATQARRCLMDYIHSVIPSVYDDDKSALGRMLGELRAHHRYLTLFTLTDGQVSMYGKTMLVGKLLTVETMQMFVLAVLYDLEGPDDDGSCRTFTTADQCLQRKAILDDSQTYCHWNAQTEYCSFAEQEFSIKTFLYILILTSIFTSVISTPLDYLFKISSAPLISEATRDQVAGAEKGRRRSSIMQGVRKMSVVAGTAVQAARRQSVNAASSVASKARSIGAYVMGLAEPERVIANRDISEDLEHLHHQAVAVLPSVSINADAMRRQKHEAALAMKNKALSKRMQSQGFLEGAGDIDIASENSDGVQVARSASLTSTEKEEKVVHTAAMVSLKQLCEEVVAQRELMPADSVHLREFDRQWGIETKLVEVNGGASIHHMTVQVSEQAKEAIYEDIRESNAEAKELNDTLPRYTVQHGGLAILNLFLLDLLGRSTVAARIFRNKFEEDFEETKAVSRWYQMLAVATLLACNGFFIYYSLLKAFQQGKSWQYQYLQGCIAQILVETLLNETLECVWLNYVVPDLVRKEVKKATLTIAQVVRQLTSTTPATSTRSILFLDATQYLFSSTKVAVAHPTLLESVVVLHYQSHLPGELSRTWPHCGGNALSHDAAAVEDASSRGVKGVLPRLVLSTATAIVLMLQWLGTMSFNFQRVVIRFVQPLLLSGLTLMWLFASHSEVGLVIVIVGTAVVVAAFAWRQYYVYRMEHLTSNSVVPVSEDVLWAEGEDFDEEGQVKGDIESASTSRPNTPKLADGKPVDTVLQKGDSDDTIPAIGSRETTPSAPSIPIGPVAMEQNLLDGVGAVVSQAAVPAPVESSEEAKSDAEFIANVRNARAFSFFDEDDYDDESIDLEPPFDTAPATAAKSPVPAHPPTAQLQQKNDSGQMLASYSLGSLFSFDDDEIGDLDEPADNLPQPASDSKDKPVMGIALRTEDPVRDRSDSFLSNPSFSAEEEEDLRQLVLAAQSRSAKVGSAAVAAAPPAVKAPTGAKKTDVHRALSRFIEESSSDESV